MSKICAEPVIANHREIHPMPVSRVASRKLLIGWQRVGMRTMGFMA